MRPRTEYPPPSQRLVRWPSGLMAASVSVEDVMSFPYSSSPSTTTSDRLSFLSPSANRRSFLSQLFSSRFTEMKHSLVAALLAVASVSANNAHLVGRQNPSSASSAPNPSSSVSSRVSASSVSTSGTTSRAPPSTITGAPGAIPIDQITSGMSSGPPDPATTTYSPGSKPTWAGAPPLPSACTRDISVIAVCPGFTLHFSRFQEGRMARSR